MKKMLLLVTFSFISISILYAQQNIQFWSCVNTVILRSEPSIQSHQSFSLSRNEVVRIIDEQRSGGITDNSTRWVKIVTKSDKSGWCRLSSLAAMKSFVSTNGFAVSYYPDWTIEDALTFDEQFRKNGWSEFSLVSAAADRRENTFWYFFQDQLKVSVTVYSVPEDKYEEFSINLLTPPEGMKTSDNERVQIGNKSVIRNVIETIEENPEETLLLLYYKNGKVFFFKVTPYDSRMQSEIYSLVYALQLN